MEHSARKALEAYRSGPDHEPAVADVLEQFIGNPASRELDFRECAPDCLQIPDELVQALMALRFATPPRPGEACKLLFPAELKAYPMWMAHVPGWLASMNLREANAPFDAVESHDDLFSFEKDDLGYDRALTTRRGRDLIRRFYEVKDGADLRVPEIEGKPLSLCQFMSSLGGFLIELRNDAQACRRVAFECGAAGTHSTPVIYIKEGDRELMVCIDSIGMLETELQAISSASHQWNVVMLVVEKLGMAATRGCRAQCLEAGRRLVAMDDRGLPVIPVDDLLGRKLRRECDGEVFSIQLPDALLFYTDVSAFRESHRQPQGTVMRRRGNGKPQTLDEFVTANRTSSNGRVEYLRRKGLRYPVFIAIMAHLRRLIAASPIGWPVEMERAFIVQAQQHLLASKERCGAEGMDDRTGVELDLAALDDMLSGYGAAAPWSITMFKDRDESGTSLLEHVLESRNKARQRRVVSQALAFFESLAPKERGILLRLAMACEDPATLRLLLTVLNPEMEEVKQLLQSGASLDVRQSDKMTLLGRAASHGDLVAVRQLLAIGCCVDQKAARGRTPLMQAVLEGHLPIVKELLAQRAQTDIRDKAGYPALAFASEQDDLEIVQALIDAGASPDHAAAHGETPLMVAAAAGQIGVANLLISRKANVLARDSQKKRR
ncbi:ankyrin repeat domain-containing protein [Rhizobacter sp. OV335]|uniref:ankyrin repeat domain-containing protein n=1 Tax=Rhizobacter sp. OV335 TaxID=1500264 RepID=UPI0013565AB7|nr:ankyrin repeat domain-containing protein [Rhizobacter sp. OV335]